MRNLLIVQGGGPTTVFNATLASILRETQAPDAFKNVYGARSGMSGLCSGDVLRFDQAKLDRVDSMRRSPGAALGSSRFKPSEQDLQHACDTLRRLNVQNLLFMGGNGTMRGANLFRAFCQDRGLALQLIGVPKTIDNDICATDRCPGFGSAGRYIAQSVIDLTMDLRSLPQPVTIVETLGRDVGWIAGAATLGKREPDDAPHVVCLPEIPFELDVFIARIDAAVRRVGWAMGVVSEGTRYADGRPVFEQQMPPTNGLPNRPLIGGVAQYLSGLVTKHTGFRCRSEKPGLLGRSSAAYVSAQDLADAELVGREAVRALLRGETDRMVSLLPLEQANATVCQLVPFSAVSLGSRAVPTEWLSDEGLGINDACRDYMRPIIGELTFHPLL